MNFADLDLSDALIRAIQAKGFQACTAIQAHTLPHTLTGTDAISQAQTGTGKTAAFLITIINHQLQKETSRPAGTPGAFIMAPTRELVIQITSDAQELAQFTKLNICALFGGMGFDKQAEQLAGPVDILIGTPGRTLDFCNRGALRLNRVKMLIIDEADRMFSMGFIPDVRRLIRQTPPKKIRQTMLFSATFNSQVLTLADQCTVDAIHLSVAPENLAVESIEQLVYIVTVKEKLTLLYNLIKSQNLSRVLVFANRRDTARTLYEHLSALELNCGILSGEIKQQKRLTTLEKFKQGDIRVLVATDVAGRGLHIEGISHVVNYNLPETSDDYIHRIGRTGRAGAQGASVSFACESEGFHIPAIEKALAMKLKCQYPNKTLLTALPAYTSPRSSKPTHRRVQNAPSRPDRRAGKNRKR